VGTGAGDCPPFESGGVSHRWRAVHQTFDERLARLLVVIPKGLFGQRGEHPRLAPIQALQRRVHQVLRRHHRASREIADR
jgi:hypothetical protein